MTKQEILKLTEKSRFFENFQLIETHISWVLIMGEYTYKIKKPVKLSFLDFSELDKRKYYCQREVELNNRLSSGIYLETVPVTEKNSHWTINGDGSIVDYAVKMKTLEQDKHMPCMLNRKEVNLTHIRSLANKIAQFHRSAPVVKGFDTHRLKATFNDILSVYDFVVENLKNKEAEVIPRSVEFSDTFIENYQHLFSRREKQGMLRDVHGDLHSGNIFLYYDPVIFDCIEFNDEFRQIDVLNDVAFFCMDLKAHGEEDLCRSFVKNYRDQTDFIKTEDDWHLLQYYQLYRANVRSKVVAIKGRQQGDDQSWKEELLVYLRLMETYLERANSS